MTYFVTGGTGFVGRNLVERLLAREGDIYMLIRKDSRRRLDALIERWGGAAPARIKPVLGDLLEPRSASAPGRSPSCGGRESSTSSTWRRSTT
jgi:thioester reductase-like protein